MIKKDPDEIWYWYKKLEEFNASGLTAKEYCDAHEIDYRAFSNTRHRIVYNSQSNPAIYRKNVPIVRRYMAGGTLASKFAKENDIEVKVLGEMVTHLGYVDIIEKMKQDKESQSMKFIQVPTVNLPCVHPKEQEVVEKQNEIEIIITKGVKVSISPNIDSMKIIKIIELLKDL